MFSKDLNVCLFPMPISWDNIDANIKTLETKLKTIHRQTDLLILPETFTTGFPTTSHTFEELNQVARLNYSSTISKIKQLATKYNLAICGSVIAAEDNKLYNRAFFIEPSEDYNHADKKHLFSMAGEDKIFTAGNRRLFVRYRGWNIAMIVCYDLRFPIWCRNINNKYDLMIAVANWPEVRINAWNTLLKARAIENQAYVCGVNCIGEDPKGFLYNGSSAVIDFKGKDISKNIEGSDLIYSTLSRNKLDEFRDKFPAYLDADRFELI